MCVLRENEKVLQASADCSVQTLIGVLSMSLGRVNEPVLLTDVLLQSLSEAMAQASEVLFFKMPSPLSLALSSKFLVRIAWQGWSLPRGILSHSLLAILRAIAGDTSLDEQMVKA